MRSVGAGAVRRNLGPDPSMKSKVDLLRRLVAMRDERRMPRGKRRMPSGAPENVRKPAQFAGKPGYNFGPPEGM